MRFVPQYIRAFRLHNEALLNKLNLQNIGFDMSVKDEQTSESIIDQGVRIVDNLANLWHTKRSTFWILLCFAVGVAVVGILYILKPTTKVELSHSFQSADSAQKKSQLPMPVSGLVQGQQGASASLTVQIPLNRSINAGQISSGDCSPNVNGVSAGGSISFTCSK